MVIAAATAEAVVASFVVEEGIRPLAFQMGACLGEQLTVATVVGSTTVEGVVNWRATTRSLSRVAVTASSCGS